MSSFDKMVPPSMSSNVVFLQNGPSVPFGRRSLWMASNENFNFNACYQKLLLNLTFYYVKPYLTFH